MEKNKGTAVDGTGGVRVDRLVRPAGEMEKYINQYGKECYSERARKMEEALWESTNLLEEIDRAFTNNNAIDWEELVTRVKENWALMRA